jgi:hypothetical protein
MPQNHCDSFLVWVSKSVGFRFVACVTKLMEGVSAGHALRCRDLLCVEASRARVFQSNLKTDGCATAGGACGTITEVMSKSS